VNPLELAGARPGPAFTVTFDGRPVEALPGQTVAAVLWAAGITSWRSTRGEGRPRGVFCGIGVCFDCLVTVNGRPNQRACLLPVRPGDVIGTQEGTGHAEPGHAGAVHVGPVCGGAGGADTRHGRLGDDRCDPDGTGGLRPGRAGAGEEGAGHAH
jgi:hypothetical protein